MVRIRIHDRKKSLSQCEERSTQMWKLLKKVFALVVSCSEDGLCFVAKHITVGRALVPAELV